MESVYFPPTGKDIHNFSDPRKGKQRKQRVFSQHYLRHSHNTDLIHYQTSA